MPHTLGIAPSADPVEHIRCTGQRSQQAVPAVAVGLISPQLPVPGGGDRVEQLGRGERLAARPHAAPPDSDSTSARTIHASRTAATAGGITGGGDPCQQHITALPLTAVRRPQGRSANH